MEKNESISTIVSALETKEPLKIIKVALNEDIYKKIKAFGILVSDDKNEAILFGNAINKMYELSKSSIAEEFSK